MTHFLDQAQIAAILSAYGYWAILVIIALESAGLPLPGETMLIGAAIYARLSGAMAIDLVVLAAAVGAIVGDNIGYWIGKTYGVTLLERHGWRVGLGPAKLRLGQYLFHKWGGAAVFFGRFITILRIFAALLAGANRLPPRKFFVFNATGGALWAALFGYGAYTLTAGFEQIEGRAAKIAGLALIAGLVALWFYYRRHEARLMREAEAYFAQKNEA